jgi:hypothetical protein
MKYLYNLQILLLDGYLLSFAMENSQIIADDTAVLMLDRNLQLRIYVIHE